MLLNITKDPTTHSQIDEAVGKAFSEEEKEKIGKINSGMLVVNSSSIEIFNLLINSPGMKTCNIEIRPDGVIIRFQVELDQYALVIPYYKLKIYKGRAQEYSFYRDQHFMKIKADRQEIHDFIRKIRLRKAEHWTSTNRWEAQ